MCYPTPEVVWGKVPGGSITGDEIINVMIPSMPLNIIVLGELTNDPLDTIAHVPDLQHICKNGFEQHVAMMSGFVASVLEEALSTYMK